MRIFQISTEEDLQKVWSLTYDVYLQMGYCAENPEKKLRHYPTLDLIPETRVFAIEGDDGIFNATLSCTIDGPNGLHTDHMFKEESDLVRKECQEKKLVLGAFWRIVTRPENRGTMETLLKIIDVSIKATFLDIDVSLFTFHPKHSKIYKRILGMEVIAGPKDDTSVNNSPAVLMRGDVYTMMSKWKVTRKHIS